MLIQSTLPDTLVKRTFEPLKHPFIRLESKYCNIHNLHYWYDTIARDGCCGLCKEEVDDMTKLNEVFTSTSTYLKKEDVPKLPELLTISEIEIKEIGDGEEARKKIILSFEEIDQVLVCNKVNAQAISQIAETDIIEDWAGKKIQIYIDPNVQFKGERIGGLRIRGTAGPDPEEKPKKKKE